MRVLLDPLERLLSLSVFDHASRSSRIPWIKCRDYLREGKGGRVTNRWDGEAESQWIVEARLLCHLQYLIPYLSCLQRIHLPIRLKLLCKAPGDSFFRRLGGALDTCFWGCIGIPSSRRVTTREVESAASSMDSDLEAFTQNPTHSRLCTTGFSTKRNDQLM